MINNKTSSKNKYSCIGLSNPKTKENIGSVLRACGNFGVKLLAISGNRYSKAVTDTENQSVKMPVLHGDLKDLIPFDCVPVAVDLVEGAQSLLDYKHPKRAFYIFGAEDATLGKETLSFCRDKVYIPTTSCMNLAATVHVVLYDRMLKENLTNEK